VLAPVLAGLGIFSFVSACLIWLQRLQPLFFVMAVGGLGYQIWIVRRRPPTLRTWGVKAILGLSVAINGLLIVGWIVITIRYW
jgi:hypothetical protein